MIKKKSIFRFLPLPRLFLLFSVLLVATGILITWYLTISPGSGEIRQQASTQKLEVEYNPGDDTPSEPEFFPNVLIVKMKEGQPGVRVASNLVGRISQLDAVDPSLVTTQTVPEIENLSLINFDESIDVNLEQAITDLQSDPDVEYVERVYKIRAFSVNDPYYKKTGKTVLEHFQWNFARVKVKEAWEALGSKGDSGVTVAVIDSGVAFKDYTDPNTGTVYKKSPELAGVNFVSPRKFSSFNCSIGEPVIPPIIDNEHALDDGGHGTHVASTIVQATNNAQHAAGIAPGVGLMPINVFTKCPEDDDSYTNSLDLVLGINYAIANGADVINMSLGINGASLSQFQTVREAIQRAVNEQIVVVVAAGNSAERTTSPPIAIPAAFPETIAVGATRYDNARAHYSQYTPNNGRGIDIMAPGGQVWDAEQELLLDLNNDTLLDGIVQQTIMPGDPGHFTSIIEPLPGYAFSCVEIINGEPGLVLEKCGLYQGTSMAAPHVSAVVALMLSANPDLTVDEVKSILSSTANKDLPGYNELEYGAGLIDALKAVKAAQALGGITPSLTLTPTPSSSPTPTMTPIPDQITCSEATDCDDEVECTTDLCLNPGTTDSSCKNQGRTGESCDDGQGICVTDNQCQDLGEVTLISLQASLDGVPYCELGGTGCTTKNECASNQFCVNEKCGNCFPPQTAGQTIQLQATFVSAKKPAVTRDVALTYDPASLSYVTTSAGNIILENLEPGPYIVVLKGPKHLATRYCYYQDLANKQCQYSSLVEATVNFNEAEAAQEKFIWLAPGKSYQLNLAAAPVKAGDLPISGNQKNQQDGMANVLDYSFLLSCLGTSSRSEVCLGYADLDYSGQVNNIDLGLMRRTLKEVVDQY